MHATFLYVLSPEFIDEITGQVKRFDQEKRGRRSARQPQGESYQTAQLQSNLDLKS